MAANPLDYFEADPEDTRLSGQFQRPIGAASGGAFGAFGRSATKAVLPTAGGVAAFPAGAAAGGIAVAPIAAISGPAAPFVEGAGAIGGGLLASFGAGHLVERGQNWLFEQMSPAGRRALGVDADTALGDQTYHPTASFLGGLTPQLLFMRPGFSGAKAALAGGAIGAGVEAGTELADTGEIDPLKVAAQGVFGGLLGRNTRLGDATMAPANALVRAIPRGTGRTGAAIVANDTLGAVPDDLPAARRSPDEQAALRVAEAEGVARRTSPFVADPASEPAHGNRLVEATVAASEGRPSRVAEMAQPVTAEAAVKAMIARHESGGMNHIQSKASSAYGRYQFIESTWLTFTRRMFPGKTKPELLELRRSLPVQERVMDAALNEYRRTYAAAGIQPTAGDLYLMHALGPKAVRVVKAAPETPIAAFVKPAEIAANRTWLKGTAGEVRQEFARRMGERPTAVEEMADAPEGLAAAGDQPPPDVPPVLRDPGAFDPLPHLEAIRAYVRQPGRALDAESVAAGIGVNPMEARSVMALLAGTADSGVRVGKGGTLRRIAQRRGPVDLLTQLADAGGIADGEGHNLIDGRNLQTMVPGAGPLIRKSGMTIDAVGEWMAERGWFPDPEYRPTTAEVLDLLDQAKTEKRYHADDAEAVAEADARVESEAAEEAAADRLADRLDELRGAGEPLRWGEAEQAAAMHRLSMGDGVDDAIAHARGDERRAMAEPDPEDGFDPTPFEDYVPMEAYARFDEPTDAAVDAQAESIEHDLRMDAAIATRRAEWPATIAQLLEAKAGEAPGALYHPEVGPIDVVWGNRDGGLAHILYKHEEIVADLPRIIADMRVVRRSENRLRLESDTHQAGIRLSYDGEAKRWLVTAYEKTPASADVIRADSERQAASPASGDEVQIASRDGGFNGEADPFEAELRAAIEADPTLEYRMNDDGEPVNMADLMAELDGEANEYGGLTACLKPGGMDGA